MAQLNNIFQIFKYMKTIIQLRYQLFFLLNFSYWARNDFYTARAAGF